MLVGLTFRPAATEFAFLVGIPTMFAATGYEFLKIRGHSQNEDWNALAHRFRGLRAWSPSSRSSGCCATCSRTASRVFAWYRIVLGTVLLGAVMTGAMR